MLACLVFGGHLHHGLPAPVIQIVLNVTGDGSRSHGYPLFVAAPLDAVQLLAGLISSMLLLSCAAGMWPVFAHGLASNNDKMRLSSVVQDAA